MEEDFLGYSDDGLLTFGRDDGAVMRLPRTSSTLQQAMALEAQNGGNPADVLRGGGGRAQRVSVLRPEMAPGGIAPASVPPDLLAAAQAAREEERARRTAAGPEYSAPPPAEPNASQGPPPPPPVKISLRPQLVPEAVPSQGPPMAGPEISGGTSTPGAYGRELPPDLRPKVRADGSTVAPPAWQPPAAAGAGAKSAGALVSNPNAGGAGAPPAGGLAVPPPPKPLDQMTPGERLQYELLVREFQAEASKRATSGRVVKGGKVQTSEGFQGPVGPTPEERERLERATDARARYEGEAAKANLEVEKTASEIAARQAEENQRAAERQAEIEQKQAAELSHLGGEMRGLQQRLQSGEVDSGRMWRGMGTGKQAGLLLAMALEEVGKAIAGQNVGESKTLKLVQGAIDRDVDEQIKNIDNDRKKMTDIQQVYSQTKARYGDEKIAVEAARLAAHEGMKAELAKATARAQQATGEEPIRSEADLRAQAETEQLAREKAALDAEMRRRREAGATGALKGAAAGAVAGAALLGPMGAQLGTEAGAAAGSYLTRDGKPLPTPDLKKRAEEVNARIVELSASNTRTYSIRERLLLAQAEESAAEKRANLATMLNGQVSKQYGFTQDRVVGGSPGTDPKKLRAIAGEMGKLERNAQEAEGKYGSGGEKAREAAEKAQEKLGARTFNMGGQDWVARPGTPEPEMTEIRKMGAALTPIQQEVAGLRRLLTAGNKISNNELDAAIRNISGALNAAQGQGAMTGDDVKYFTGLMGSLTTNGVGAAQQMVSFLERKQQSYARQVGAAPRGKLGGRTRLHAHRVRPQDGCARRG